MMALSQDQVRILAQTLLGEAGGEGLEGMKAVAHVIKNRANDSGFPSDPVSVALQPKQFSAWNHGAGGNNPGRYGPGSLGYDAAVQAIEAVFNGNEPDPTGGATHYWAPRGMPGRRDPYWARSEQGEAGRVTIGNHVFLPKSTPGTALSAANELAGAPPERPASMSAYTGWEQTPPPLPRADPRGPYQPPLPRPDPRGARVRPFNPGEFVSNPDGTQSTERTITWQRPDGQWVNTPTLFMGPNGVIDMSSPEEEAQARGAATSLMRNGTSFPTFGSQQEAVAAARARSNAGGAGAAPGAPPPLPRQDPRRASQRMNDIAGMAPPSVLPRLNDADINERLIDTYGPDPQATSPTQGMWNEYYSYLPQSVPSGPATRQARGQSAPQVPQTPQVPNSLRAAIGSGMYDPMSDTSQHAGIFDAYQPAVPQSPAPPLPQADPRRAFAPLDFPWNDDMQQAEAGRETLFGMGLDPLTPDVGSLPRATPAPPVSRATIADLPPLPQSTQVAQAPIPPQRPMDLPQIPSGPPMATFAGQQAGGNPVEQAGQFLGDFQNNGGIWGMGLNALAGRGLFPGDDGVIPQFKADVASRMEQGADPISAVFSRTNRRPPMFTSSAPQGYATPVRSVSRSGGGSGFLSVPGRSGPSRFDQEYHSGQNMDVARANQRALRNASGDSTREKIDNYLASGGTLYKAG